LPRLVWSQAIPSCRIRPQQPQVRPLRCPCCESRSRKGTGPPVPKTNCCRRLLAAEVPLFRPSNVSDAWAKRCPQGLRSVREYWENQVFSIPAPDAPQTPPSNFLRTSQHCRGAPCSHQRTWADNDGRSPQQLFVQNSTVRSLETGPASSLRRVLTHTL
jgi:hypothetical protein